jgi:hypothetical protein
MASDKTKLIIRIINYFLGLLFVLSAVSKLFPIHSFELTMVSQKIASWNYAPFLSRLIIGFELFLGFSFFQKFYLKSIIYPSSFILLMIFNVHLIYSIAIGNSADNCGCFGQLLPMTSLEALIKNLVLMGLLIFIYFNIKDEPLRNYKLPLTILIVSYLTIFILFPVKSYILPEETKIQKVISDSLNSINEEPDPKVDTIKIIQNNTEISESIKNEKAIKVETESEKINLLPKTTSIFAAYKNFSKGIRIDVDYGIKLVALFSLDCDHCMQAAKDYANLEKKYRLPPMAILFLGETVQVKTFFDFAEKEFPYIILDVMEFFPYLNSSPPRLVLLNNGNVVEDSDNTPNILEIIKEKYSTPLPDTHN